MAVTHRVTTTSRSGRATASNPTAGAGGETPAVHVVAPSQFTSAPRTSVSTGGGVAFASWSDSSRHLWPAWCNLDQWEDCASDQFGIELGAHLLVLWALHTFGTGTPTLLDELIGDDAQPRFGDEVLEDVARVAFSLGAGWGVSVLFPPGDRR